MAGAMFSLAESGEKSRDASTDNKEFSSFLQILMKQNSFLF